MCNKQRRSHSLLHIWACLNVNFPSLDASTMKYDNKLPREAFKTRTGKTWDKPKCAISSGCASAYCTFVLAPAEGLLAALTRLLASLAKVSLTIMREIIPCIINMISNTMFETCSTLLFVPLGGKSWVAVLFIAV